MSARGKSSNRKYEKFRGVGRYERYDRGHVYIRPSVPVSERPPAMPPGDDPRAGTPIKSLHHTPSLWKCIKSMFKRG